MSIINSFNTSDPIAPSFIPLPISGSSSPAPMLGSVTAIGSHLKVKIPKNPTTNAEPASILTPRMINEVKESNVILAKNKADKKPHLLKKIGQWIERRFVNLKLYFQVNKFLSTIQNYNVLIEKKYLSYACAMVEKSQQLLENPKAELKEIQTYIKDLEIFLTTVKTDSASLMTLIKHGKAKQIWTTQLDSTIIYYTPFPGKRQELEKEVQIAKSIHKSLAYSFCSQEIPELTSSERKILAKLLIKYPDLIFEKEALAQAFPLSYGIAIQKIMTNPEVKQKIIEFRERSSHLLLEMEEIQQDQWIKGRYTLKAKKADGDLEHLINTPTLPLNDRLGLGQQIIKAMSQLHKAGFVHADLKPENFLVYKQKDGAYQIKMADFGKTKKLEEAQNEAYKGNVRFAPPEGRLSQKGEVFTTALMLIRTLEGFILKDKEMLIPLESTRKLAKNYRGIEKHLILNPKTPQDAPDSSHSFLFRIEFYLKSLAYKDPSTASYENLIPAVEEVHKYIDALMKEINQFYPDKSTSIQTLGQLLKQMTAANPSQRINWSDCEKTYASVLQVLTSADDPQA